MRWVAEVVDGPELLLGDPELGRDPGQRVALLDAVGGADPRARTRAGRRRWRRRVAHGRRVGSGVAGRRWFGRGGAWTDGGDAGVTGAGGSDRRSAAGVGDRRRPSRPRPAKGGATSATSGGTIPASQVRPTRVRRGVGGHGRQPAAARGPGPTRPAPASRAAPGRRNGRPGAQAKHDRARGSPGDAAPPPRRSRTGMRLGAAEALLGGRLERGRRHLAPAALAALRDHGAPGAVGRSEVRARGVEPLRRRPGRPRVEPGQPDAMSWQEAAPDAGSLARGCRRRCAGGAPALLSRVVRLRRRPICFMRPICSWSLDPPRHPSVRSYGRQVHDRPPERKRSWRRPIFPRGYPLSIFGAGELNFRVRDGNGCGLSARVTRISVRVMT